MCIGCAFQKRHNHSMKCLCILWFVLVCTFGSLSSGSISITRNAKLPNPGSSPDEFTVHNPKCSNRTTAKQCEEFGAVRAIGKTAKDNINNQECLCVCKREKETLVLQDRLWKCLDNHALRAHTGSRLLFRNENASSGLFTFGVGQWTYFSNLATSSGKCEIRYWMSSFLQCNGSWAPLPSRRGLFLVIQDASTQFRFQVNNVNGLSGRIIKLAINCPRFQGNHSVAFKLEGILKCPEEQHVTSTIMPLPTEEKQINPLPVYKTKNVSLIINEESSVSQATVSTHRAYSIRDRNIPSFTATTNVFSKKTTSLENTLRPISPSALHLSSSELFGKRTDVYTYRVKSRNKGSISIAVLATTIATAFLFGMLLVSLIVLRKRRLEEQRTRTQTNSAVGIPRNVDIVMDIEEPVYAQVGTRFEDRHVAVSQMDNTDNLTSTTTTRTNYDYIWPNVSCSSTMYQHKTQEDGKIDESRGYINVTPKTTIEERDDQILQERTLQNDNPNYAVKERKNICEHAAPQANGNANRLSSNDIGCPFCSKRCNSSCHPYDRAISIIRSSKEQDSESPIHDFPEGSDPNIDYHCCVAENRVYGQIEKLGFEDDVWQL